MRYCRYFTDEELLSYIGKNVYYHIPDMMPLVGHISKRGNDVLINGSYIARTILIYYNIVEGIEKIMCTNENCSFEQPKHKWNHLYNPLKYYQINYDNDNLIVLEVESGFLIIHSENSTHSLGSILTEPIDKSKLIHINEKDYPFTQSFLFNFYKMNKK